MTLHKMAFSLSPTQRSLVPLFFFIATVYRCIIVIYLIFLADTTGQSNITMTTPHLTQPSARMKTPQGPKNMLRSESSQELLFGVYIMLCHFMYYWILFDTHTSINKNLDLCKIKSFIIFFSIGNFKMHLKDWYFSPKLTHSILRMV